MSLKISGDCQPPTEQPNLGLLLSKNEWKNEWMSFKLILTMFIWFYSLCIQTLHFGDVTQSDWRLPPPQSIAHESPNPFPRHLWIPELVFSWSFCLCTFFCLWFFLFWSKQERCSHWFPQKSIQDLGQGPFHTWHSKQLANLHQTFLLAQSFITPLPRTSLLISSQRDPSVSSVLLLPSLFSAHTLFLLDYVQILLPCLWKVVHSPQLLFPNFDQVPSRQTQWFLIECTLLRRLWL